MPSLHLSSLSTRNVPFTPPWPAGTHPAWTSPRCCSFPLISRSSRSAPRASWQTKHQKPGLVVQEGNPLTWGAESRSRCSLPASQGAGSIGYQGTAGPTAPLTSWGTKNPSPPPLPPYLLVLRNKTLLLGFIFPWLEWEKLDLLPQQVKSFHAALLVLGQNSGRMLKTFI